MSLTSPDPTTVLHGTVNLQAHVDCPISAAAIQQNIARGDFPKKNIGNITFFLDGKVISCGWGTNNPTLSLNTTTLNDGVHQLRIATTSFPGAEQPIGEIDAMLTVSNGHVAREIRPMWGSMHLAPREQKGLVPQQIYTDSDSESVTAGSVAITYSSSNPAVAEVDSDGNVTALTPGFAMITLTALGKSTHCQVWVDDPSRGFPHFGKDGSILTKYDPTKSIFVRSVIQNSIDFLSNSTNIARAKAAALNVVEGHFYYNPADMPSGMTLAAWKQSVGGQWDNRIAAANANGLSLLPTGDDLCRTFGEASNTASNPWASDAIRFVAQKAAASNKCVGVLMEDEIDSTWGPTPRPATKWPYAGQSVFPLTLWTNLVGTIHSISGHPNLAFPNIGLGPPASVHAWQGDPTFADFGNLYWTYLDGYPATYQRDSLSQGMHNIDARTQTCLPVMQRNKPVLLLTQMGPFPLNIFQPGEGPNQAAGQIMLAAIRGYAGTRAYVYNFQTQPPEDWAAMSAAYQLIADIEPRLLQQEVNAIHMGDDIATGARSGPQGNLLMAMNSLDVPQTVKVDLSSYTGGGSQIKRYRLIGNQLTVTTVPNVTADTITFAGNEIIVWAF
jgi:hypothetical protein